MFTKMIIGPLLFARHAQRKASDAVAVGAGNPVENLWGSIATQEDTASATPRGAAPSLKTSQEQLLQGKVRRQAVYEKYSKGSQDGIRSDVFKQALSEMRQEFVTLSDADVQTYFVDMDVNTNEALDEDEFRRALQKPFPIEQAVSALPLSRVIASALPGLHGINADDQLKAFSKLGDEEVAAMAYAVSFELEKLLLEMVHDLRKGFEVKNNSAASGSDAGAKFSVVLSGGKIEDFHAGLAGERVGELRAPSPQAPYRNPVLCPAPVRLRRSSLSRVQARRTSTSLRP